MSTKIESERILKLRKRVFELQKEFLTLLANDNENPPSKLEEAFCSFLWQIDEAWRKAEGKR